jgi:hypothetical protein
MRKFLVDTIKAEGDMAIFLGREVGIAMQNRQLFTFQDTRNHFLTCGDGWMLWRYATQVASGQKVTPQFIPKIGDEYIFADGLKTFLKLGMQKWEEDEPFGLRCIEDIEDPKDMED